MKRSALFTMQKLNILIYWLNKLQNANMGFLLVFKIRCRSSTCLGNVALEDKKNHMRGIEVCYPSASKSKKNI